MGRVEGPLPCFPRRKKTRRSPGKANDSITTSPKGFHLPGSQHGSCYWRQPDGSEQSSTAPFYIPLFIGIYILSRWIDRQLEQKNSPPDVVNSTEDTGSISNPTGFKS